MRISRLSGGVTVRIRRASNARGLSAIHTSVSVSHRDLNLGTAKCNTLQRALPCRAVQSIGRLQAWKPSGAPGLSPDANA